MEALRSDTMRTEAMGTDGQRSADEIRDVNTRYHDVAASSYDSKWGIDFGEVGQGQVVGKLRKLLGRELDGGFARSLEVGAGTGYFTLNLVRAGIVRDATCTDISPGMVRTLAGNAERLGLNVKSLRADAESLPFGAESFDLVLGHAVLHHLPDLERAFSEFHRVLKPGGRIVFAGEPSRVGDRLAAIPKRGAVALAPAWRRALRAGPPPPPDPSGSSNGADHGLEPVVDIHAFAPDDLVRARARRAGSTTSACAARNCSRTGSGGSTARSRRAPIRPTCRCCGASTRSAATCCCSGWTSGCSSRCCRRRSSTT